MDRAYTNNQGTNGSSSHEMKSSSSGKGKSKVLSMPSRTGGRTNASQNRDNANVQAGQSNQQFRPMARAAIRLVFNMILVAWRRQGQGRVMARRR